MSIALDTRTRHRSVRDSRRAEWIDGADSTATEFRVHQARTNPSRLEDWLLGLMTVALAVASAGFTACACREILQQLSSMTVYQLMSLGM